MRADRVACAGLLLVVTLPVPAWAETVSIGFSPPIGRDFAYRIAQRRPVEGRDSLFTADRTIRFEKAPGGYVLVATLRGIDSDAPVSGAEPYRAALSPLIGVEHRFRVDATGRIAALENRDVVWAQAKKGLRAMTEGFAPDSPRHRAAANVLALFDGLSDEGQLALLAGELQPLFLFANSVAMDGEGRALRSMAGSPLGRPVAVEGRVRLASRAGDVLKVEERLTGEGAQVAVDYEVAAGSGLVVGQRRTLAMGGRTLTETRSLKPVN